MAENTKVSLVKCSSYSGDLRGPIEDMLDQLGGLSAFVKQGQTVLIKPNMLTDRTPEEAVTTHPEIVRVIIRMVRELGAKPVVGDSPCSAVKLEKVWEKTGFKALCEEEDVTLLNLEKAGWEEYSKDGYSFNISKPVLDADVIINVPKVKTHIMTTLTAAMKNLYGTIPGYRKAHLHKAYPNSASFGRLISQIYKRLPPALNIADGIIGMEGNGPSAGTPVELGFLAASANAPALDLTLCRILGIKPKAVPYLTPYVNGTEEAGRIEIVGADMDDLTVRSFKIPNTLASMLMPVWLVGMIAPFIWIRPAIDDKCVSCGMCVKACPADALEIIGAGSKPVLDGNICIGCCCCHEVCPEKAVTMALSPLLNFIRRGKSI